MRQERKKERNTAAISLVLCFSVIAIASVFTVRSNIQKLNLAGLNPDTGSALRQEQPVTKPMPIVDSQNRKEAPEKIPEAKFEMPLSGEVIREFSSDTLVYSKTLDQYMTHYGIDIAAPADTPVRAVADGTVTKVSTDSRYGITIEIDHGDGLRSVYANLSTDSMTETGDVVTKGQVISGVGNTSLFESLDESHLHFEMQKDETAVDPHSYLEF